MKNVTKRVNQEIKKPTILIVDDDSAIIDLLRVYLPESHYRVLAAMDAVEFERHALKEKPDIILLDILLGKDDGTACYAGLLQKGLDRTIPVVFMSSLAQDISATPPDKSHCYSLISKPFNAKEFVERITVVLNAHGKLEPSR